MTKQKNTKPTTETTTEPTADPTAESAAEPMAAPQQRQPSQVEQVVAQANQAIGTQNELFSQALQQLARGAIEAGNAIGDRNALAIMRLANERDQAGAQLKRAQGLIEKMQADLSSTRAELDTLKRSLEKAKASA